ncbi:SMI1/KNR4 family protein [Flavobacterium reichenbachii]|uniref:Knr4/Smi1-like domain-containing protein n=1 Tax=Flavobacterium reichenbachii TaxID=362418 RepID=A0A085ZGA3_9FLAO|nr:SMI1/KNR4 family protein [Flavobacterium reichenbachii]KFF03467.1 hypothetical protein IW19_21530 [Flavobacterium reichenbachii]OXB15711.1 SMI1/KNR4 family protein [Flavobacterium reichenbachii]
MIEINKKEDILIPFSKIGDSDWTVNTKKIIESIADNYGDDLKKTISKEEIFNLEKKLGTSLPENLKLFYETFGIADIGEQLQDFEEVDWIKGIWADAPQYGPDFTEEDKKLLPYLISFSDYLGNGNMFCFHSETKEIYYYDHDSKPYLTKIFDTVDDYLKGCLIFAQNDFSESREIDKWTEEIVSDLVGEKIVRKWRY